MLPRITTPDGVVFRDLNGNGVLDPYEDPRLGVDERVADLLGRLSLAEKVGCMFQTVIESGPEGALVEGAGAISKSATTTVVTGKLMNHFNVHQRATHAAPPAGTTRCRNSPRPPRTASR